MAEAAAIATGAVPPIHARGLGYRYTGASADALCDVDLRIGPGEFVVLAGRSASGKTTLLRAACGLVPHFHGGELTGSLEVGGRDAADAGPGELARSVAYVAQDPETQIVSTTVGAEIGLPLELRGDSANARARAVEEVALALAIPHLLGRATDTLSGGELQRVALAAALVTRPPVLLLDEPTSQLDPVAGDELLWLLRRLNEEWGVAILIAEHRLERCLSAADRVVAMAGGTIAFDGEPRAFLTWALGGGDPTLATPAARLFSLAGINPLPTGVREARRALDTLFGGRPSGVLPLSTRRRSAGPPTSASRTRAGSSALRVRDLSVDLDAGEGPREVLRSLDLEVRAGERVALLGRNGAGKSTLLRTAAGLIEPVGGSVETPAGMALLGQSPSDYLVRESVGEELPGEAGEEALRAVGLEGLGDRDPRDLSGGERQRLALAIAIAGHMNVGLVALDEPTRGMDRARKEDLAAMILGLAEAGSALLVATHDMEFATLFADRVVLLGDGAVVADGTVGEVLSGGWYFATEVARILDLPGVITPEQGAEALHGRPG